MGKFTVAEVEYEYGFPQTVEGYAERGFTIEAVLSMLEADLTRRLQSQVRAHLDDGKSAKEAQEFIAGYIYAPGTKRGSGGKAAAAANILAQLPPEAFAELAAHPEQAREILARYMQKPDESKSTGQV